MMHVTPSMLPHLAQCRGWRSSSETSAAADRGWAIDDLLSAIAAGENPEIPEDFQEQVSFGREVLAGLEGALFPQKSVLCFENSFMCGTADLVAVSTTGKVVVIDWKTGYTKRPPAGENLQLLSYAAGIAREFQVAEVEARIVELDQRTISSAIVDAKTAAQVEAIVETLCQEAEKTTPGEWQACTSCKYCARKETCPAIAKTVAETSALVPVEATPADIADKMTPEQAGAWLDAWAEKIDIVAAMADHVRGRATSIIAAGGTVPGYRLKPGRKSRKWADLARVREILGNDAFESVPLSVATLEKRRGKQAIPAELIVETRGNPQLVKEGDVK